VLKFKHVLILLILLTGITPAVGSHEYMTNSNGERFRVLFDQKRFLRIHFGRDIQLGCGIYGFSYIINTAARDVDGQRWKNRYTLFRTEITDKRANRAYFPQLKTMLFTHESMYYQKNPYITLPTRPPSRVTVPFNFGLQYSVLGLEIPNTDSIPLYNIDIVTGKVVLDWIPSPDFTTLLQLNFGVVSRILFYEKNSIKKNSFILAPFTAVGLRLRLASATGRRSFDIRCDFIPAWTSQESWGTDIEAEAIFRLLLFAVNDRPLYMRFSSTYKKRGFSKIEDRNAEEWTLGMGIELSFQMP